MLAGDSTRTERHLGIDTEPRFWAGLIGTTAAIAGPGRISGCPKFASDAAAASASCDVQLIADAFQPIFGLPSWQVQNGYGSWVSMEFGEPTLAVGEPHPRRVFLGEEVPPKLVARRAEVHGPWRLWVECAYWALRVDQAELAHCESDRTTIARALGVLNGQALDRVAVDPDGSTTFSFDLGGVLDTKPAPDGWYDRIVPLWHFTQPGGHVLSLRSDGRYAARPGDTPRSSTVWTPLAGGTETALL